MVDAVRLRIVLVALAGWVNRHQLEVIAYIREENRVLREQLDGRRVRLTDAQRRRLAVNGHRIGRQTLRDVATLVTPDTTLDRAAPVGPFGPAVPDALVFSLITTKAITIASTATMLPDAMRIRRRCSARRSATRCAAIFSLRLLSTFVLLALPMLASSNPCVSQLAVRPHVRWSQTCVGAQE